MTSDIPSSSSSSSSPSFGPSSGMKRGREGHQEGELESEGMPAKRVRETTEAHASQTPSVARKRLRDAELAGEAGAVTSISSRRRKVVVGQQEVPFSELNLVKHLREDFQKLSQKYPDNAVFGASLTSESDFIEACREVVRNTELKLDASDFSPLSWRFLHSADDPEVISHNLEQMNASYIRAADSIFRYIPSDAAVNEIMEEIPWGEVGEEILDKEFEVFKEIVEKEQEDSEEIVEKMLMIPLSEFLGKLAPFVGELPEDRQTGTAAKLFCLIPKEQRKEAKEVILSFINGQSHEGLKKLVSGLKKVPKEKRLELLQLLDSEYKQNLPKVVWKACIKLLAHIPSHQRAELLPTVVSLFENEEFPELLSYACREIESEKIGDVLYHVQRFCTAVPQCLSRGLIVEAVAKLPKKQRAGIVDGACYLCEGASRVDRPGDIFKAINDLVPAERGGILKYAKELLQACADDSQKILDSSLITALAAIDRRERPDVVQQAKLLIPKVGFRAAPTLIDILGSIGQLPRESLASFIKGQSDEQCKALVSGLEVVPKEKMLELLQLLNSVYKQNLPMVDWKECVKVLALIPSHQRAELLPTVVSLFENEEDPRSLFNACWEIEPEKIGDVLYNAQRFCTAVPQCLDRGPIVEAVAGLPKKQRAGIVDGACYLCEGVSTVEFPDSIIEANKDLVPAERARILKYAKELLQAETDDSQKILSSSLITALAAIDRRERRDVVQHAKLLMPKVGLIQAPTLIKLLRSIDLLQRESVASLSLTLLEGVDRALSLRVIEAVKRIQPKGRDELIAAYMPRLSSGLSGIQNGLIKAEILQTISSFEEEDREIVFSLLLSLMARLQSNADQFFLGMKHISFDKRITLLNAASSLPILQGITDGRELIILAWAYNELLPITELVELLMRLPIDYRKVLCTEIRSVAPPDREEVFRYASRLLPTVVGEEGEIDDIPRIVRSVAGLSAEQRELIFSLRDVVDAESLLDAIDDMREQSEPGQDFSHRPSYKVVVTKEQFENEPEKLLESLTDAFKSDVTLLSIEYEGQPASDAGGPGRQFVSDLCYKLVTGKLGCKEIGKSGLYRPKLKGGAEALTAEEKKIYHNLGRLLMFCLNSTRDDPTGVLFDEGVFAALLSFSDALLEGELQKKPEVFSALLSLFERMNALLDSELQSVSSAKEFLGPLPEDSEEKNGFLERLYSLVEYEDGMEAIKFANIAELEPHVATMQAALRDMLFNNVLRPNLAPLHEIARGMKSAPFTNKLSWAELHSKSPGEIATRVQGVLDRELIAKSLNMVQPVVEGVQRVIPEEKQNWLRDWVRNTSDENLKRFLQQVTGSRALGTGKKIDVIYAKTAEDPFYFRTCFNWASIPFDAFHSEGDFAGGLETILLLDTTYNRA